jgi:hypothetical protein
MILCKVWTERCQAAKAIEDEFGTPKALAYLVGEKFLNFLEAAGKDSTFSGRASGLRCGGQAPLRAAATGGMPRNSTPDGAVRRRYLRGGRAWRGRHQQGQGDGQVEAAGVLAQIGGGAASTTKVWAAFSYGSTPQRR